MASQFTRTYFCTHNGDHRLLALIYFACLQSHSQHINLTSTSFDDCLLDNCSHTPSLSFFGFLNSWITTRSFSIHAHPPSLFLSPSRISRLYNKGQKFHSGFISPPLHTHCISIFTASDSATNQTLTLLYPFSFPFSCSCIYLLLNLRHHPSIHIAPTVTTHPYLSHHSTLLACPFSSPSRPLLAAHNPSSPIPSFFFYSPAVTFDFLFAL
ncbi:uncharacterized protein LACBIDRAFT_297180 [Laccaria bicolor S238N-H82]|uniref:Predicted protein n=1 Tax=Laccaria bicolor (strain S238N-H82 / ATCC MYA-4686) TaxID=486041 RepID=B0DA70_LACBS|nr:uncharacterized protein LACBIDRAFT_297180 [Laccaria bicolor S238N-H82]EDR08472.1 predicted protein [Laccaria bicolor S238N-H82]|eukprot:XP_001880697.1 predicted protein [Laccaria bicolor S238N-H82]